jgi:hypothetical protein
MEAWKEELYHHGIQGQKWGVRRYQNADGSLTAAGKKHVSQKANIKSSNDSAASSGGGGGGGAEEEEEEEEFNKDLDNAKKEMLDSLLKFDSPAEARSYMKEEPEVFLAESAGVDTSKMSKKQVDKMIEEVSKVIDDYDKANKNKVSDAAMRKARKDAWTHKQLEGAYHPERVQMRNQEQADGRLTHSDSSKAYVGTLGMKWKISN